MAKWEVRHGSWWMLQWCFAGWVSLGIHIEPRTGVTKSGYHFGPYVDFHILCFILSLGRRPAFTHVDKWAFPGSRGGINPVTEDTSATPAIELPLTNRLLILLTGFLLVSFGGCLP